MESKLFSKLFLWLFVGLMVTFITGYAVAINANMFFNVFGQYYIFIIIAELALAVFFTARIAKMQYITAVTCYLLYALLSGLTFGVIFVIYELSSIVLIFGLTSLLMLVMGLIGYYTNVDLSKFRNVLVISLILLIIFSIINIFLGNAMFDVILLSVGSLLFLTFIAYDINRIKNQIDIMPTENMAVYGAFRLYLDFINLFIRLLSLFGKRRR